MLCLNEVEMMLRVAHWSRRRRLWWALVFSWFSIGFWSVVWQTYRFSHRTTVAVNE